MHNGYCKVFFEKWKGNNTGQLGPAHYEFIGIIFQGGVLSGCAGLLKIMECTEG
jgi:hypothetical protein